MAVANAARVAWKPVTASSRVASVRLRTLRPADLLRHRGWTIDVTTTLERGPRHDVVVFQKAYADEDIDLAARLRRRRTRVVLDLCDNHLYNPDGLPELAARADRLLQMVELADLVTVSTPTLGSLIPHDRVQVVDDALEVTRCLPAKRRSQGRRRRRPLRLVWFGNVGLRSPPFGVIDLPVLFPHLAAPQDELPLELLVVTSDRGAVAAATAGSPVPVIFRAWRRRGFQQIIRRGDVCVLPATLNPFTTCKTANRVVTALLAGVPVVASPIPSYAEFAPFIRISNWEDHLRSYAQDDDLVAGHVDAGQRFALDRFSDANVVNGWERALALALDQASA